MKKKLSERYQETYINITDKTSETDDSNYGPGRTSVHREQKKEKEHMPSMKRQRKVQNIKKKEFFTHKNFV